MKKNLFPLLINRCKIIALLGALFLTNGCSVCDCEIPMLTISQILSSDAYRQSASIPADFALDSAHKYFNQYPELEALMAGATPYTLFAPSNTAFINFTAIPGLSNLKAVYPDIIRDVLVYHFVVGKKMRAELTPGASIGTLYSETKYITTESPMLPSVQKIKVNADGTLKTGSANQSIIITKENLEAENGIVHIVGTVLIPPSIAARQPPPCCSMSALVHLGEDFTQLVKIIGAADAIFTETATEKKINTYLTMPATNFPGGKGGTFFASPNSVLTDATVTTLISSADKGRSFLLNHLVAGKHGVGAGTDVTVMSTGQALTSFSTKTITVVKTAVDATNPNGIIVTSGASTDQTKYAPILTKDMPLSNGLIQVIGGVLQ